MRVAAKSAHQSGDVFHKLTLDRMLMRGSHRYWICKCDCGNSTRPLREDKIVKETKHRVRSCGCLRAKKREEHHLWRGCGELDGQFYGFIKCHAKRRGISFDLSITFLWELFLRQGRMCALTGLPITFETLNSRKHGAIQTASLDRKDSSRGYVQDNVQWVHKDVNYMKNDYTMDRFLEVCRLVVERYGQSTSTPARTTA